MEKAEWIDLTEYSLLKVIKNMQIGHYQGMNVYIHNPIDFMDKRQLRTYKRRKAKREER